MTTFTIGPQQSPRRVRRNLVRHYLEMVAAMVVGMAVLGGAARLILAMLGDSDFLADRDGLRASVMTVNMTIGMAVWMRHRGHGWGAIAEMSAAMFVPLGILIGPFWAGALSGDALVGWMHVLMLPAMAFAMQHRRAEYAHDHHHHDVAARSGPLLEPGAPDGTAVRFDASVQTAATHGLVPATRVGRRDVIRRHASSMR
jgi:flagellar biosynthetic protein FliP